jgi:hypothetical protein
MKIAAVTLAFNDEGTIAGTIKCLQPFVDRHVVLISDKPYFGEKIPADRTEEIANDLGCDVVRGNWPLDHYQRTLGNKLCAGYDWVLTFDSDEMMESKELERFLVFLSTCKADAVTVKPIIYWRTTDYVLEPRPDYEPPIAMRPKVEFTHIRNIDHEYMMLGDKFDLHHLSWCAPKDIKKKITHYAHADLFDGDAWYKCHYDNWQEGTPVHLPVFIGDQVIKVYQAKKQPLPKELQDYL